jgi:hypothetical protein
MLEEGLDVKLVSGVDGQGRRVNLEHPPFRLRRGVGIGLFPGWRAGEGAGRGLRKQLWKVIVRVEIVVVVVI